MNPKLLIVDDNALNATIASVVLVADGFRVEIVTDAAQALEKIRTFGPHLILMDIQMPGMDGLELTRLLKSAPATRDICVVAFTAFAMRGDEDRMRAAGCDGYLSKPIDVKTFAQQVRTCLAAAPRFDPPGPATSA